jgi:eukaryotic-like serine/threonine-protein kinase
LSAVDHLPASPSPARWGQIERLFTRALDLSPERRDGFLAAACSDDDELRREVGNLLAAHEAILAEGGEGDRFLEQLDAERAAALIELPLLRILRDALGDRYAVERRLGSGGMGEVFAARDLRHDRMVAIKIVRQDRTTPQLEHRFEGEVRIAARLQHPHIVPLYDSGEAGGHRYYVMPLVDGPTLRQRLQESGRLPVAEVLRIVEEVAGALDCAHASGIVHRDIKPENILLSGGHALVADFGVARPVADIDASATLTGGGSASGTAAYMSPEQAAGRRAVDGRSDQYALACVAYELFTGRPPFTGETVLGPSRALDEVMARGLANDPAARFASTAEFARALRAAAAIPAPSFRARMSRRSWRLAVSGVAVAAVAFAAVALRLRLPPLALDEPGRASRASTAVLPFADLSEEPQEYFSDGITEEIIAQLSTISGLKVISRTSVMQYKGRTEELREIGRRLGVTTVLQGSVRRAGDRVRVVAQLIDTRTDEHLWTQTYDLRAADIFAIQSDIAKNIARELQILLSPQARERISAVPTRSTEAYNFYLRGRYLWNKRTSEAGRQAITLFERALQLDPAYARAYAALAEVYAILPFHATAPISETNPRARAAARRALELDSTLAPAHAALGLAAFTDWRWDEARHALRRATELDPGYAAGHSFFSLFLFAVGECLEASHQVRLARELDPLSVVIVLGSAFPHACAGDFDGALRVLREALAMDSTFEVAWRDVITLEEASGRLDRALAALQRAAPVLGIGPDQLTDLQRAYASRGAHGYWQERIELAQHVTFVPGRAANYAQAYAAAGDRERALEWLERAYAEHEVGISLIRGSWAWRSLRDEPRFQQILRRMGLR